MTRHVGNLQTRRAHCNWRKVWHSCLTLHSGPGTAARSSVISSAYRHEQYALRPECRWFPCVSRSDKQHTCCQAAFNVTFKAYSALLGMKITRLAPVLLVSLSATTKPAQIPVQLKPVMARVGLQVGSDSPRKKVIQNHVILSPRGLPRGEVWLQVPYRDRCWIKRRSTIGPHAHNTLTRRLSKRRQCCLWTLHPERSRLEQCTLIWRWLQCARHIGKTACFAKLAVLNVVMHQTIDASTAHLLINTQRRREGTQVRNGCNAETSCVLHIIAARRRQMLAFYLAITKAEPKLLAGNSEVLATKPKCKQ